MSLDLEEKLLIDKAAADHRHKLALDLERARDHYSRNQDGFRLGMVDAKASMSATIGYGQLALRGLFILNIGGVIAAAGFLSATLRHTNGGDLALRVMSLLAIFALGAAVPVIAAGIIYMAQYRYTLSVYYQIRRGGAIADAEAKAEHWWRYVAIACMVLSCACFGSGIIEGFRIVRLAVGLP
jgi:hypothetical protein